MFEVLSENSQFEGDITFDNVSTKYKDKEYYALSNVSFKIKKGEKVGIIGRSGSGKSTLIKLIWRCLEPCEGSIKIDGKDIKSNGVKFLRNRISIVNQEPTIFSGTLRENIDPQHHIEGDS